VAISKDVTPSNWKQSAATEVVIKKRSMIFTAKQQDSKDSLSCLCTAMSQLTSLLRASAVIYEEDRKKSCKYYQASNNFNRKNNTVIEETC